MLGMLWDLLSRGLLQAAADPGSGHVTSMGKAPRAHRSSLGTWKSTGLGFLLGLGVLPPLHNPGRSSLGNGTTRFSLLTPDNERKLCEMN